MHARSDGECIEFIPVEMSSRMEDVSVLMKRGAEKVSSPEDGSRETVTILMSLGLVLVYFKVAELFYEDRFGDAAGGKANCATGWDIEDEKQMKEVTRRVRVEEHGRTFDSSAKMDENRGWFLGMCLVPKRSGQTPVPKHTDRLLEVRVLRDEDVGSMALWNWEFDETHIILG